MFVSHRSLLPLTGICLFSAAFWDSSAIRSLTDRNVLWLLLWLSLTVFQARSRFRFLPQHQTYSGFRITPRLPWGHRWCMENTYLTSNYRIGVACCW